MTIIIRERALEIRALRLDDLEAALEIYQQCEDFLALGPEPTASMGMVLNDFVISQREGGILCGIFTADRKMIGVVDYIPGYYQGNPHTAFLSLLMVAASFRNQGIGKAVVKAVENEIRKDPR